MLPIVLIEKDFSLKQDGDFWMTAEKLGKHLGFGNPRLGVMKLYERHADELQCFTILAKVTTPGGIQDTRVFNPQACLIIAMLARTDVAKPFRLAVANLLLSLPKMEKDVVVLQEQNYLMKCKLAQIEFKAYVSKSKLSSFTQKRLLELREIGLSAAEMARVFKVGRATVNRFIRLQRHANGDFRNLKPEQLQAVEQKSLIESARQLVNKTKTE